MRWHQHRRPSLIPYFGTLLASGQPCQARYLPAGASHDPGSTTDRAAVQEWAFNLCSTAYSHRDGTTRQIRSRHGLQARKNAKTEAARKMRCTPCPPTRSNDAASGTAQDGACRHSREGAQPALRSVFRLDDSGTLAYRRDRAGVMYNLIYRLHLRSETAGSITLYC